MFNIAGQIPVTFYRQEMDNSPFLQPLSSNNFIYKRPETPSTNATIRLPFRLHKAQVNRSTMLHLHADCLLRRGATPLRSSTYSSPATTFCPPQVLTSSVFLNSHQHFTPSSLPLSPLLSKSGASFLGIFELSLTFLELPSPPHVPSNSVPF